MKKSRNLYFVPKENKQMEREGFIDYYEILQLNQRADQETMDRVYRFLAKRYHPDNQNTGDPEKSTHW